VIFVKKIDNTMCPIMDKSAIKTIRKLTRISYQCACTSSEE